MNARIFGIAVLLALGASSAVAGGPDSLRFDDVFSAGDTRAPLHYRASYTARGTEHGVEVWVDGGVRLKRVTDASVELHAQRQAGQADFRMTVLDLRRRVATRVDSTNLQRLGHSVGWSELAQGLREPRGAYRLVRSDAPAVDVQPVQPCDWYALSEAGRTSSICWQPQTRLPMLIADAQGHILWRVTAVDRVPIAASVLQVDDDGFVRNDAGSDIADD